MNIKSVLSKNTFMIYTALSAMALMQPSFADPNISSNPVTTITLQNYYSNTQTVYFYGPQYNPCSPKSMNIPAGQPSGATNSNPYYTSFYATKKVQVTCQGQQSDSNSNKVLVSFQEYTKAQGMTGQIPVGSSATCELNPTFYNPIACH